MATNIASKSRQRQAWTNYRLNRIDLERMIIAAAGHCEICRDPFPGGKFAIDHCHATGKARGLLCKQCNLLLGNAKDDVVILKWAAHYLQRSRGEDSKAKLAQFVARNPAPAAL